MKFRKMLSGVLAFALAVTSAFAGNVSTVKAAEPAAADGAVARDAGVQADEYYYIINTKTGGVLNGGNSWGTQASALSYGELLKVVNEGGKTYIKYGDGYMKIDGSLFMDGGKPASDNKTIALSIEPSGDGSYTIAKEGSTSEYLTASADNTVVTLAEKSEYSNWRFLTREQFLAEAQAVSSDDGFDVTSLIADAAFTRNNPNHNQWKKTSEGSGGGFAAVEKDQKKCFEAWSKKFEISQEITGVPNGIYELNVQGAHSDANYSPVYYINGTKHEVQLMSGDMPTEKFGFLAAFEQNKYWNTPIRAIVTDGKLTVGIKLEQAGDWVIWEAFNLKYRPLSNEGCQEALDQLKKPNILGTNQGYKRIRSNLDLQTDVNKTLDGTGASIVWTSSNPAVIGNDGVIQAAAKNGDVVEMTAKVTISGSTASKEWTYPVRIAKSVPVSPDDACVYDFNDGLNGAAVLDGATWRLDDYEGEVTYGAGRSGAEGDKALSMDGSYGLELPHYNLGDTWTVSMWYCPQAGTDIALNSQLLFVGYGEQPGEQKWLGVAGKDGDTASYKIWASGSVKEEGTGDTHKEKITPIKGKWNLLTITQDADKQISVYDNGVLLGQNTDYTEAILSGNNQTIYLGTNFWDPGFKGLIDDVTVSKGALTEDEVAEAYLDSATAEDFKAVLEREMLGENESLEKVTKELTLPDTYLGKTITWTNSNDKALAIEETKATVAAKGKLPENTTLAYKLDGVENGMGTFEVQAGTEESFDRQEFFSKAETEQKNYVKAEIEKDFLNGNQSEKQVVSDLKLLLEVSYKKAVIAGIAWSSNDQAKINTTETPGTGKVKYDKNLSEKVTLTATVSPDDGAEPATEPYSIPFRVKVVKPAAAAPFNMGNSHSGGTDTKNEKSNTMDISVNGTSDNGTDTKAPAITDVSLVPSTNGGGVGSERVGYLVFNLASLLKGDAGTIDWTTFDPETIEYAYLKLHVNSLHAQTNTAKIKIGLYPVQADKIDGITNTDASTYPAAKKNAEDEEENAYDKDHVTWGDEWLTKDDKNKVVTFDVKQLVLAAAEAKQDSIAFRVQVPFSMLYVAGLGDSDAAKHPSLSVQLRKSYTDADKVEDDIEELSTVIIPDKLDEDSALTLPAEIGEFKSQVTWTSDNDAVKLEKDEENKNYKVTVTRPKGQNVNVVLTAKVANGEAEESQTFTTRVDKYMTGADLQGKLIAGFTFDDAETGLKGNGASAAVKGTRYDYMDGKNGKALYLGANTWLEVTKENNSALLKGKEEITVSYYSKSNFAQTGHGSWTFFAARDGNNFSGNSNRHYLALLDAKNAVKVERWDGNSGHAMEKTELDNEWRKVDLVVTKDKTTLYIDGEKAAENSNGTQALTKILGENGGVLFIGKGTWGSGEYYDGLLDEYKIYDRALTAEEVSRMYQRDAIVLDADTKLEQARKDLAKPAIDTEDGVDTITFADTVSQENCSISWTIPTISEVEVLEAGKKIKLTRGNAAVTFKVTATITYKNEDLGVEKSVTEEFDIVIPKIGDKTEAEKARDDVKAAKAELQAKTLTVGADDKITLPQTDSAGKCTIKWTAPEDSAIKISEDGKTATVTRGDSAAQVKLTAQITHKTETSVKDSAEITVTVPALTPEQRAQRDVKAVKEALEAPVINADDTITFKTEDTEHNCTIAWSAPEGSAVKISEDGKTATVTRGTTDQNVKLTATITSTTVATVSDTKELTLTITKLDSETVTLRGELTAGMTDAQAKLNGTKAEDYPAGVWQALSDAIEAADKASKSGTKEEMAAAKEALEKALANFKTPAEVQEILAEAIGEAEELDSKAYTEDSYQKYSQALEALKGLSDKADLTAAEVAEAVAALKAADEGLVVLDEYKPSEKQKEDLGAAITDAAGVEENNYVQDDNWKAFQAALKKAQAISSKPNATKAQVEKAINDLKAAKAKLTLAAGADKKALNTAIKAAEKLVKKTYTTSTWKAFQTALTNAKNIYAKADATQKQVNDAEKALKAKQKALKKAVTKITVTDKATGSKAPKIAMGKKVTLKVAVAPAGASSSVTYSIAKKQQKYATVSKKGVVTTKKAGAGKTVTVTVTAKDGSKKKTTIKISIMKNAVTKITLKAAKKVKAGRAVTIKATVKANGKKANKAVVWSIDKKSAKYASINSKGKLTTKKTGKGKKVTVTATSADGTNKKAKVTITLTK